MTLSIPHRLQVVKTKFNGTLHHSYEGQLLDNVGSMVRVKVPSGTPVYEAKYDDWSNSEDTAIEIYFTDRWYNVWHLQEHTTYPNLWYANVAMPAKFDGATLHWVDLDIDVRCYLDGSLKVLDEDEFEQNRVEMGYPSEIVEHALAARDEVLRLGKDGLFPFDHEAQLGMLER